MKLPDQYQCDRSNCSRVDATRVAITFNGKQMVEVDLCERHLKLVADMVEQLKPKPSATARALDPFIRDR